MPASPACKSKSGSCIVCDQPRGPSRRIHELSEYYLATVQALVRNNPVKVEKCAWYAQVSKKRKIPVCCDHLKDHHPFKMVEGLDEMFIRGLDGPASVASPARPKNSNQRLNSEQKMPPVVANVLVSPPKPRKSPEVAHVGSKNASKTPKIMPYAQLSSSRRRSFENEFRDLVSARQLDSTDVNRIMGWSGYGETELGGQTAQTILKCLAKNLAILLGTKQKILAAWLIWSTFIELNITTTWKKLANLAGCSIATARRAMRRRRTRVRHSHQF